MPIREFACGWYHLPPYLWPISMGEVIDLLLTFEHMVDGDQHRLRGRYELVAPIGSCWPPLQDFLS